MKKIKKTKSKNNSWPVIVAALIIVLVGLIVIPRFKLLAFLSPQGQVDIDSLNGEADLAQSRAIYNNKKISLPNYYEGETKPMVLGENNSSKRIEVDLTNQRVYAIENGNRIYDFPVSSGLWGRTPTGTFRIWVKLRYTLMTGGSTALGTYYYLPNVPYVMFFYNDQVPRSSGYSLHGTYWHSNFGHPMSHGCLNMKTEDVEKLYYWAGPDLQGKASIYASADNPGTEIVIYGNAPWE